MEPPKINFSVELKHQLTKESAELVWNFYEEVFAPLNEQSPCRQNLHHDDFIALLESARFVKLLATESDGTILGLTVFAVIEDDMPLMPWINPEYFKKHWPEFWGRIIYVPTICVPMNSRSLGAGQQIMSRILEYMRDNGIPLIGFDHSVRLNPVLPDLIIRVTSGRPVGNFSERGELDHQSYWLLADRKQLPKE